MFSAATLSLALLLGSALPAAAQTVTSDPSTLPSTFDYVVIGGGTSGLTVASRLTENPATTVLVIEAGNNNEGNAFITNPANQLIAEVFAGLNYTTTTQFGNRALEITQGNGLGGSSAINGLLWGRGTQAQYDSWGALGNTGWNFANLQSCMKKAEKFTAPNAAQVAAGAKFSASAHGTSGKVNTGFPNPYTLFGDFQAFFAAATSLFPGAPRNPDPASGSPRGIGVFPSSLKPDPTGAGGGDVRSESANSYLFSLGGTRKNLFVLIQHRVDVIEWATPSRIVPLTPPGPGAASSSSAPAASATGVRFLPTAGGAPVVARARKEVLVAAGTLNSPAVLERSGVGNPSVLKPLGIPVQVPLPAVGTNLQDQPNTLLLYALNPALNASFTSVGSGNLGASFAFLSLQDALGTAAARSQITSLYSSAPARAAQIVKAGGFTSVPGALAMFTAQTNGIAAGDPVIESIAIAEPVPGTVLGTTWALLPQSRGSTHISASDPTAPAIINPNYLATPFDLTVETAAARATRSIFTAPAMAGVAVQEVLPGLQAVPANASDAQWQAYIGASYLPVFHPIGSCALLPQNLGGVVSPTLVVYGTANVRVIDASVIPMQISNHLSSTVYGIAEKAAIMIQGASSTQSC